MEQRKEKAVSLKKHEIKIAISKLLNILQIIFTNGLGHLKECDGSTSE